jgi:LPS sulfotransferase NodH
LCRGNLPYTPFLDTWRDPRRTPNGATGKFGNQEFRSGRFGCKLHYSHYLYLAKRYDIQELFPNARYIHLMRRDLLGQAISYAKARATRQWIAAQPQLFGPAYS